MTRSPLVIRGRTLRRGEAVPLDIGVDPDEGRIVAVGRDLHGDRVEDHKDALIVPGAVDVHVHFRDPGHPEKEDFASGTRAALAGGVTTVFDMPNTNPPTLTLARYREKLEAARAKAATDWGLWGGTVGDLPELRALAPQVPGIKVYMGESTGGLVLRNGETLARLFATLRELDYRGVLAFHAEAQEVLEEAMQAHAGSAGLAGHAARRPAEAETQAFRQIQSAGATAGAAAGRDPSPFRVHMAHASTLGLLQAARDARVSAGVTPHHLLLHHGLPLAGFGRVNPPLRDAGRQQALLQAFCAGEVPVLESDHAPHTRAQKERPVEESPSGMPGVETMVPVLMARTLAPPDESLRIPLGPLVQASAAGPARLFGLDKGSIRVGLDADLAVYHKEDLGVLDPRERETRCGWSPFEGWPVLFPRAVYRRGEPVVVDKEVVARPGSGRQVGEPRPAS